MLELFGDGSTQYAQPPQQRLPRQLALRSAGSCSIAVACTGSSSTMLGGSGPTESMAGSVATEITIGATGSNASTWLRLPR